MKRFYAICGALAVGFLLVGSVHAGPPHSRQRSGQFSRQRSGQLRRQHSGRRSIALRPRPWLLPWQLQQDQSPGSLGNDPDSGDDDPAGGTDDPNAGGSDPDNGTDDPNNGTDDPNSGTSLRGRVISGVNSTRQAVTSKGGNQRRLPRINNGSSRIPASPPRRR
jgi:hypothetical protein